MDTLANITVAADGAVLVTLPALGLDAATETRVWVADGALRVAQRDRAVFTGAIQDPAVIAAMAATNDITVVEAGPSGFVIHSRARKVKP